MKKTSPELSRPEDVDARTAGARPRHLSRPMPPAPRWTGGDPTPPTPAPVRRLPDLF